MNKQQLYFWKYALMALAMFLILFLFSCGGEHKTPEKESANSNISNSAAPSNVDDRAIDYRSLFQIAEQESLEIYNDREEQILAADNIGEANAFAFLQALLGSREEGTTRKIINGNDLKLSLNESQAIFIVIDDNLPDDSIKSDIRFFDLLKTEKSWSISSVTSVWKCYEERGHQDYSTELCH